MIIPVPVLLFRRAQLAKLSRVILCIGMIALLAWAWPNINVAQRTLIPHQVSGSSITFQQIATGLSSPVVITHAGDGSGRLFIVEQGGFIKIFQNGSVLATPFLNIASKIESGGEKGLLGLTFHPNYETNRRFFVNYTTRVSGQLKTRVAEYLVSTGNPNIADANSERLLLEFDQPFDNHNAGDIQFGLDGYLYITSGDGGSGGDPQNNGQSLSTLLGKILRIDVNSGLPYGIPASNPFVDGNPNTRDEIWSYGLRNPWRFSFDRLTGDMFIGDVGQGSWEEVDHEPANTGGRNYGWRIMEGLHCYNPSTGCDMTGLTLPILEYSHSFGCSVTGGYRYRGSRIPELYGVYVYGDYCSGRVWAATFNGSTWTTTELADTSYFISTFGEDESGEIYLADYATGRIYKVARVPTVAVVTVHRSSGNVYTDGAFFCGLASNCFNSSAGADLAERINTLEDLEPGDVVEIDLAHPGYFRKSRGSHLAIGVVSTRPGLTMANRANSEDARPAIALIGRVPVNATTENGAIQPGDLLTPALSKRGYAMRCDFPCRSPVLGKALEGLRASEGLILMLVMRP